MRGDDVADPDLEWDAMIRAGRTDPAGAEELPPGAAYSPERSAEEQIAVLTSARAPYAAAELRQVLCCRSEPRHGPQPHTDDHRTEDRLGHWARE